MFEDDQKQENASREKYQEVPAEEKSATVQTPKRKKAAANENKGAKKAKKTATKQKDNTIQVNFTCNLIDLQIFELIFLITLKTKLRKFEFKRTDNPFGVTQPQKDSEHASQKSNNDANYLISSYFKPVKNSQAPVTKNNEINFK